MLLEKAVAAQAPCPGWEKAGILRNFSSDRGSSRKLAVEWGM